MISLEDGKKLVKLARHSIETFFSGSVINMPDEFNQKRGVFVTLSESGKLRGCIGYPEPVFELKRAIIESARSASFKDPRFPPITEDELDEITIEVSVLTKPELLRVKNPKEYLDKIKIGKHGLIIRSALGSGLLLPIVAVEYDWTPKEFLEHTCEKTNLPPDSWNDLNNKIFKFKSQVFAEEEPHGDVIEKA